MERVDVKQVARIAPVDAVVWVWFLQVGYGGAFSERFGGISQAYPLAAVVLSVIIWAGLIFLRWDSMPCGARNTTAIVASFSVLGSLIINRLSLQGGILDLVFMTTLSIAFMVCQLLRVESFAKCGDVATLTMTACASFALYYLVTFVVLIAPQAVYDAFVIGAPLLFLIGGNKKTGFMATIGTFAWQRYRVPPSIMLILLGAAGGLLYVGGNASSPLSPAETFVQPSPIFLVMILMYMELMVLVSSNFKMRKTMYFALTNAIWCLSSLGGQYLSRMLNGIPNAVFVLIATVAVLAVLTSFIVFQNSWVYGDREDGEKSGEKVGVTWESIIERIAGEHGLTQRETEILHLLLEGRSLPYIEQQLYISDGTARTHAAHIYRKLGVHNKQELIDLFKNA